jgi:hypothetical protein
MLAFMAARRGWGSDAIYFDHHGPCTDPARHCPGRWRGVVSLGSGPDDKRIRRKVSGKTKAFVADRLAQLHRDPDAGARPAPSNQTKHHPGANSRANPTPTTSSGRVGRRSLEHRWVAARGRPPR